MRCGLFFRAVLPIDSRRLFAAALLQAAPAAAAGCPQLLCGLAISHRNLNSSLALA